MPVRTKRWDEPVEPEDGWRILITRYRPRGLPKAEETWSEWLSELGPSPQLHAAFYGKNGLKIGWQTYRARYLREMLARKARVRALAERVAGGETLTLLCSSACRQASRCHRSLLKKLIEDAAARGSPRHPHFPARAKTKAPAFGS